MKDAAARALLRDLFDAALSAARPATCLAPHIDKLQPPQGSVSVHAFLHAKFLNLSSMTFDENINGSH